MTDHRFVTDVPELDAPVLVVMLTGWIDASGAAAGAMSALVQATDARPLVAFDDDLYIDYRARRPTLELREGVNHRMVWASPELQVGRDVDGKDVVLLTGPEPDMAWHRFAATIADLATRLGVTRMAAVGAYPFATPHTRPVQLSATSPSRDVLDRLPFRTSSVDVPGGAAAALEVVLHDRGIPSVGVWAQVPHYVATMAYPAASVALLEALATVVGISVDTAELRRHAVVQRERLDQLVDANEEHRAMVTQLERLFDAAEESGQGLGPATTSPETLPGEGELEPRSGDELAAEVERFLRDQGKNG